MKKNLAKYIQELKNIYDNGGVEYFEIDFKINSYLINYQIIEKFLINNVRIKDKSDYPNNSFLLMTRNELLESMRGILMGGGAYNNQVNDPKVVKEITEKALVDLLDSEESSSIVVSYYPWNDFFYGVAWDYTVIILNKNKIKILMATDTD